MKLIMEFSFVEFGTGIGTAINNAFNSIDFTEAGLTVSGFINGVFETLDSECIGKFV